jgi:hypothetical protein
VVSERETAATSGPLPLRRRRREPRDQHRVGVRGGALTCVSGTHVARTGTATPASASVRNSVHAVAFVVPWSTTCTVALVDAVPHSAGCVEHAGEHVRFCRYRFPATDLNSKATWFGI